LYGRALDGNASDITAAAEFLDHLHRQIPDPRGQVFVADSKGWAPPALECVRQHQLRLLSRLPRSTRLAGETVARLDLDYASCLLKHYHKDRKRWSWVAYAGFDEVYCFTIDEPILDQQGKPQTGEDGQPLMRTCRHTLPVRVVACYSSELYRQKAETLGAITKREEVRSARLIRRLGQRLFACTADAQAEIDALVAKQPFITLTLAGTVTRREIHNRRSRRGRPAKGEVPPSPDIRYTIALTVTPASPTENASRLRREATYVLIRNRIDGWEITDEQMAATYSKQWRVEHAFSWLKSGAAINPMFVQTPRRIQALCFLYTLALMIHALVQRNLRRYLKQHGLKLPYHRNKPSQNITARFTYELFRNVTTQIVEFNGQTNKHIHGLDQWTKTAIAGVGGSAATYQPVMEKAR
jgi:transposase